jgi:hypothetical protein
MVVRGPPSPASNPRAGSDSDIFEDWPEVNDMAASVYIALTADALSSRASAIDALCHVRESCASDLSGRLSCSRMALSKKPWQQKTVLARASRAKSKKTKIDAERALVAPAPCGGLLSSADFNKSEWEIMYLLFVEEGLINSSV